MKRPFLLALAFVLVGALGCGKPTDSAGAATKGVGRSGEAPEGAGGEVVSPMTGGAAGGATPMSGTDSVTGAGSGVGSAAKDRARSAAAKAGQGSAGQTGDE